MMLFPQHFLLCFFWYHLKEVGYLREGKKGHRRNEGPARGWLVIRCSDMRRHSLGNIWFYYLAGLTMANLRLPFNLFDLFYGTCIQVIKSVGVVSDPFQHTSKIFQLVGVWDIYHKNPPNVGKYTSPMDPMGYMDVQWCFFWLVLHITLVPSIGPGVQQSAPSQADLKKQQAAEVEKKAWTSGTHGGVRDTTFLGVPHRSTTYPRDPTGH